MDDIETQLQTPKRRRRHAKDIVPTEVKMIRSLSYENKMNFGEGETEIFESEPTVKEVLSSLQSRDRAYYYIEYFSGELVKLYMRKFIDNKKTEIDHLFGLYLGNSNKLIIGNSPIEFENDNIIVNDTKYEGTPGLYELIFMNRPNSHVYTQEDLDSYTSILKSTKAFNIAKKGYKYTKIIKKLFPPKKKGAGLISQTNNRIDYVHWNDPNELCDRLRLLISSKNEGHTGHENEIISIIEELREAKVIK